MAIIIISEGTIQTRQLSAVQKRNAAVLLRKLGRLASQYALMTLIFRKSIIIILDLLVHCLYFGIVNPKKFIYGCHFCDIKWFTTKGSVSHQQPIEKAHAEYDKFKKKQDDILSPVEKHFIESIDRLEQISTKK